MIDILGLGDEMENKYETFLAACDAFSVGETDTFAEVLSMALDDLSMLQSELADSCEVGPSTMSRWVARKARPMKRTRKLIVKELRIRGARLQAEQEKRDAKKTFPSLEPERLRA